MNHLSRSFPRVFLRRSERIGFRARGAHHVEIFVGKIRGTAANARSPRRPSARNLFEFHGSRIEGDTILHGDVVLHGEEHGQSSVRPLRREEPEQRPKQTPDQKFARERS